MLADHINCILFSTYIYFIAGVQQDLS